MRIHILGACGTFMGSLAILARPEPAPLVRLFDEVDAGLGMDAATPVALLLRRLSTGNQALCVTHLPTVSVHGDQHWLVSKHVDGGRTSVRLDQLDDERRVAEVARQLGGEGWRQGDAAAQTDYARQLLAAATRGAGPAAAGSAES